MNYRKIDITNRLLAEAHGSEEGQRIFEERIFRRKIALQPCPPRPDNARRARWKARKERERGKALKPKPLSAKERRTLGVYKLSTESKEYSAYVPLHNMWIGYIRETLGQDLYHGGQAASGKLASAEFVGAKLNVSRSSCPSRVGLEGIVIKDTKYTFEMITQRNAIKIIPKEGTLFRIKIPAAVTHTKDDEDQDSFTFDIHGVQFQHRPADRSNKKFKFKFLKDL